MQTVYAYSVIIWSLGIVEMRERERVQRWVEERRCFSDVCVVNSSSINSAEGNTWPKKERKRKKERERKRKREKIPNCGRSVLREGIDRFAP